MHASHARGAGRVRDEDGSARRDDRVLRYTRGVSLFIAPFLLVGFFVLYVFPDKTGELFAWTVAPRMTPMVMASAYLGGFYFFVRVLRESRWTAASTGFLAVTLFATLLGVATIIHWDKFNHGHVAFWLWAGLYFTAPFLVIGAWIANQRFAARPGAGEQSLGGTARVVVGVLGLAALATGLVMFAAPTTMIGIWPWALTPLTCRVIGAVFCLGAAGLSVVRDPRWVAVKLMLQVEAIMVALILIAAARAHDEFLTDRPLTWLMLGGFGAVLVGSGYLWYTQEIKPN